jgi:hypothetical protein
VGTFTLPPLKKSTLGGVVTIKMPALPVRSPWDQGTNGGSSNINLDFNNDDGDNDDCVDTNTNTSNINNSATKWKRNRYITHPTAMSGWRAFLGGQLCSDDYVTFFNFLAFLLIVFILCSIFSATEEPSYAGNIVWSGVWVLTLTIMPLIKYFNHFTWTWDMTVSMICGHIVLFIGALIHFITHLRSDLNSVWSLMTLLLCFYWPNLLALGWAIKRWSLFGTGFMEIPKSVQYIFSVTGPMYILLVFVVYVWVDVMLGAALTLLTVVIVGGVALTRDWASNDYFVSAQYSRIFSNAIRFSSIFFIAVGFFFDVPIVFFITVGFFCIALGRIGRVSI